MSTKLLGALMLLALLLGACTAYTGIAIKGNKAYISVSDASTDVCDIAADGKLTNCN